MTRPTLTIVHSSDTHTCPFARLLPRDGDVFVLSGDGTYNGTRAEVELLAVQLNSVAKKFKHVLFVPGNHDFFFQDFPDAARDLFDNYTADNVHLLIYEWIIIDGYKFYGQPSVPELIGWAFAKPRKGTELDCIWGNVPDDVDVIISHGPPHKIHDIACSHFSVKSVGCEIYAMHLPRFKNLKLALFGHIHEHYGASRIGETIFSNGCLLNRAYDFHHPNAMHSYELNDGRAEFLVDVPGEEDAD